MLNLPHTEYRVLQTLPSSAPYHADVLLTYAQAAERVHRTTRSIMGWRAHGMPVVRDGSRVFVDEAVLLEWYRDRLEAWPTMRYRRMAAGLIPDTRVRITRHADQ